MIQTQCPHCQKVFFVKDELAGRFGLCPQCRQKIQVPQAASGVAAGAPQPPPQQIQVPPPPPPMAQQPPSHRQRSDWDEEDDYDRPRRRKKNRSVKKRRRSRSSSGFNPFYLTLAGLAGFGLLLSLLALLLPVVGMVVLVVGALVCVVSNFWFLGVVARDGAGPLLLCLFVPFYALIYLITHFEDTKQPFFMNLVGLLVLIMGAGGGAVGSVIWERRPGSNANASNGGGPNANNQQPAERGSNDPGLRIHLPFDEGEGTVTRDKSTNNIQGKLNGCQWVAGVRGAGLHFNGVSDYVDLGFSQSLTFDNNTPFTIAGWVKTTSKDAVIFCMRRIPEQRTWDLISVRLDGGKLRVWVRAAGDPFFPTHITAVNPINDGQWHHFAVCRDNTGMLSLYLDGVQNNQFSKGMRGPPAGPIITTHQALGVDPNVPMGNAAGPNSGYYNGVLDELYVYGRTLSDAEINKMAKR